MKDEEKSKEELMEEIARLRASLSVCEGGGARSEVSTNSSRTEEALKVERKRLYSILDVFPGFVYLQAPDHSIAFANRRFIEAYGEPNGRPCYEVMWDRKEPCDPCPTFRVFETKEPEVWVSDHTSRGRVYQVYDEPFVETDGSMLVLEISIDITERKRAGEAIRVSEERYRGVIDNIGIGVSLISPNMEILTLNRQMREWFPEIDSSEKPVCYKAFNSPPREGICSYCPTHLTLDDGQVHEAETETPAGDEIKSYRIISSPLKDDAGNVVAAIEMVEEITERKRAEEEANRNYHIQRVISSILQTSLKPIPLKEILQDSLKAILSVPFFSILNKGSIFLVDEESGDMLRLEVEHGLQESLKTMCATVPFGRCVCGRAASSRETVYTDHVDEEHVNRYDGIAPHGHYCVPIILDDRVIGVINTYIPEWHKRMPDEVKFLVMAANTLAGIIERKRTEKKREELQAQLLHSQKMEAIGRLTGGIAHDFNNIMTAVKTLSSLGARKAEGDSPIHTYFTEINNASKRATALTKQLLLFSKKGPAVSEAVDVNAVIETNLSGIISSLIREDITLTYDLAPELWTIEADTSNIEQIIVNLIINAKDAMPEGGSLTVRTENNNIKKTSCTVCTGPLSGRFVSFEVTDTGVGMDDMTVQKVFEPFFTTKPPGKGTGLGLSVIYGIVNSLKGCIDIASKPGDGTAFRVYIPASEEEEQCPVGDRSHDGSELQAGYGGGGLILLVEDNDLVHKSTGRLLTENGYRVEGAATLAEARRLFKELRGKVGLLLTDVTLPDGDGIELAKELAATQPGLRVIIYSGHTGHDLHLPSLKEPGVEFIEKPFEIPVLLKAVKKAMS